PTAVLIEADLATGGVVPLLLPETNEWDFRASTSFPEGAGQELEHTGFSAALQWQPSAAWTMKSITAWRALESTAFIDIDASVAELGDVLVVFDQEQLSQE